MLTLTWAAAFTQRVQLGTSVLVLPMRHPLPLAKELATLQNLSQGRLILGAGVGWMEAEFDALGVPFRERGRRMDEGIALMRAVWTRGPGDIPDTLDPGGGRGHAHAAAAGARRSRSGSVDLGCRAARALRLDGWHGSRVTPEPRPHGAAPARGAAGRRSSPSRCACGGTARSRTGCARNLAAYAEAGVQHVLLELMERELDAWLRAVEDAARLISRVA